jgi:hypothetical protein
MNPVARVRWLGAALLLAGSASACAKDDDSSAVTGCAETVREASRAVEVDEQVRLLDRALIRCRSLEELTGEMANYPGIVGYDLPTFVQLRCSKVTDEAIVGSPACAALIAPTTTVAGTAEPLVYVGETLDGRSVEIKPDADTPFVGESPAAVQQNVDTFLESGCVGVITQRDVWAEQIDDPVIGDEASVYAKHAERVADYVGCVYTPFTLPQTTTSTSSPV